VADRHKVDGIFTWFPNVDGGHSRCSRTNLVLPLVAVSGAECVEALTLDGFTVRSRSDRTIVLERDARVVAVPDVSMLNPEELEALLVDAGIAYDDFLDLLSETPTERDVLRPTSGIRRSNAGTPR
jgi:hypothetical protein